MRHRVKRNRLSRAKDQREALLRSLTTDLLRHDEIVTTLAKAKALRSQAEKMITLGKRGHIENYTQVREKAKKGDKEAQTQIAKSVHMRRQVASYLRDRHKQKTINEHRQALKDVLAKPLAAKGIKGAEAVSKAVRELSQNEKELAEMLPNPDAAKSLVLRDRDVVHRVFNVLAPRYKDRQGGYTRIVKLGFRAGDAAEMALIQLV